jgi:glycine/D-amino acid oxidase-like deaminating enzyme
VKSSWPLILDEEAPFYFRPEGDGVIMSLAEVEEMTPPDRGNEIPLSRRNLPDLAERATHRCSLLSEAEIRSGWAGLRTLTPDGRPLLGHHPLVKGLYIATGFSGHGITLSPFTSEYITREVLGRPFEAVRRDPFSVSRCIEPEKR